MNMQNQFLEFPFSLSFISAFLSPFWRYYTKLRLFGMPRGGFAAKRVWKGPRQRQGRFRGPKNLPAGGVGISWLFPANFPASDALSGSGGGVSFLPPWPAATRIAIIVFLVMAEAFLLECKLRLKKHYQ